MGNCFSDVAGGQSAVGGTGINHGNQANAPNEAVDAFLNSRGYQGLYNQIELSLSATSLRDRDVLSKSDPMTVLYSKEKDGSLKELSRTEVVLNSLNPKWITKYTMAYYFETVQNLVFRVYDIDTQFHNQDVKMLKLEEQDFLGEASCILAQENPLIIECYDFNSNGKHSLLGKIQKSLLDLEKLHSAGIGANLFVPTAMGPKQESKVLKSQLFVESYSEKIQYTFLDYLPSGYELIFMVAIDFPASNGNPRLPDSLHYIDPSGRPNAYQRAILDVGEVLQFYDTDKRFPAWGFGARPFDGPVSHCFNLNGSSSYCEVEGIQGIMMAYMSALHNVSLAGPTLFGPVITSAVHIASQSLTNNVRKYFVLLIITDGVITDLQETKDALVQAANLPLSILIVGVGGADFEEMEILDADKGERLESTTGRIAVRDIVQFVPLRDVQNGDVSVVQSLLAELPSQLLEYMRFRKIQPTF